ncbi:MAG: hypothetical protein ABI432_13015 [Flavobacteriales bacterium]
MLRLVLPVIAGILAGAWVLDEVVMRAFVMPSRSAGAYKIQRMFEEEDPTEVAILGSSRAAGCYVPDLINRNAFNYGIERTEHGFVEVMLERELRKARTTPIIVNWDYEFFRTEVGNMAHFVPNLHHAEISAYARGEMHWYHRVPGLRFFGLYGEYFKTRMGERSTGNVRSDGGVFDNTPASTERFSRMITRRFRSRDVWTDPTGVDSTFLRLLRSSSRPIVIVVAPYHASYFANYKGMEAATEYLRMLDALPNITVLDFGRYPLPDDHFFNTSHVNYRGAQVFSAALGEEWKRLFPVR